MKKNNYRMMKISDINPAAYNPRDITEHAFAGLKESIKKFGLPQPLIVNVKDKKNILVGGHQRLKAVEALGMTEVPVIEVELSPAEEKTLNITLNNQAISGHFTDSLQDLLNEIKIELPEIDFSSLLLSDLEVNTNWDADFNKIDNVEENLDGITAKIVVEVPQDAKDLIKGLIKDALVMHPDAKVK